MLKPGASQTHFTDVICMNKKTWFLYSLQFFAESADLALREKTSSVSRQIGRIASDLISGDSVGSHVDYAGKSCKPVYWLYIKPDKTERERVTNKKH